MRYLTLSADYGALSLRDEEAGPLALADVDVPASLTRELEAWNSRYQPIVPMDMEERQSGEVAALIDELDQLGLALAGRLADALGGGAKVKYYSEGRLRHLP
jgi:hypothetical protein